MHIAGQPVTSAEPRPVQLPYDGSEVGTIYQASKEQVDAAVAAALAAAPIMREMTLDERSTILRKAHQRLPQRTNHLHLLLRRLPLRIQEPASPKLRTHPLQPRPRIPSATSNLAEIGLDANALLSVRIHLVQLEWLHLMLLHQFQRPVATSCLQRVLVE